MGEKILINKDQLELLINESINRIKLWKNDNGYKKFCKKYPDHTFLYCRYLPEETGLDVDILLNEGNNYCEGDQPLWLYFDNNLPRKEHYDLIPVAIHRFRPFILDGSDRVKIPNKSLDKIYKFIRENYYAIVNYSNRNINYDLMSELIKPNVLKESLLVEMPTFKADELKLPTDIWIDGGDRKLQHGYRIKFRDRQEEKDTNKWATMTIDKFDPETIHLNKNTNLSNRDIEELKDFVKTNYDNLILIAQGKISNRKDIKDLLLYRTDIKTLLPNNNNTIPIDFMRFKNELTIVGNNDEKTKALINALSKKKPFEKYNDVSLRINVFALTGNLNQKISFIKNKIDDAAKNIGYNVKYNGEDYLSSLDNYYDEQSRQWY